MSCWMKNLILDTNFKAIQLYLGTALADELHITTHYYDYYKAPTTDYSLWNRYWYSDWVTPVDIVDPPSPVNCWKREIHSISVYNPNSVSAHFFVTESDITILYDGFNGTLLDTLSNPTWNIIINADNPWVIPPIVITFSWVDTVADACDAWNLANPGNTVSYSWDVNTIILNGQVATLVSPTPWLDIIIVERVLLPNETRTLECICSCCAAGWSTPSDGINIYDEWMLVYNAVTELNFIGACLDATRNNVTNQVDVTLAIDASFDCQTYEMSICW